MKPADISEQILLKTLQVGKTYDFSDGANLSQPADFWFQESFEGVILFVVFRTQACRWSRCLGCNLPSKAARQHVSFEWIMRQVDHLFQDASVCHRRDDIRKVIVSNNGSVLDQTTFSSTALMYFLAKLNLHLSGVKTLTLESRPEYVELAELEFIARALQEGPSPTNLELGIGFEAMDDTLRNQVFRKGLSLKAFEKLAQKVAPYGYSLKCYFMLKPVPGLDDKQAVEDIHAAIDYLEKISQRLGVNINLHLNPTYVAKGTALEKAFRKGEYTPPRLSDVALALQPARGSSLGVFVGLFDEGLAIEGGSFLRPEDSLLPASLEEFNRTQNYDILDNIVKGAEMKLRGSIHSEVP